MVIKDWLDTVYAAIQEHRIHKDDIWDFDGTGFAMRFRAFSVRKQYLRLKTFPRPRASLRSTPANQQQLNPMQQLPSPTYLTPNPTSPRTLAWEGVCLPPGLPGPS